MIDLARCEDFALGAIVVRPSSRELVGGGGAVMLEPKVMQVLVALAQAGGQVVSRDDLIDKCWSGRIVGDDAVNRIIGKLRRIADGPADGAFRIETVARTGHRLFRDESAASDAASTVNRQRWPRVLWFLLPAAVALLLSVSKPWQAFGSRSSPTPERMPTAVNDLEIRGLAAMFDNSPEQTAEGVDYLRKATALAPLSAPVWGSLAMSYVLSLGWTPPSERAAVVARARAAATHGLSLDPAESRSAAALVSLAPTFAHWSAKEAALAATMDRARPDSGPLAYQEIQFLMAVGRGREALATIKRMMKFSPLVPWIKAMQIDLLAGVGQLEEADRAADEARDIWPRDRLIWFTRFDLAAFNGQPERALAMAADRANWPKQTSAAEVAMSARVVRAMMSRDPAETVAVLNAMQASAPRGQADAERAIRVAAALGRTDIALAIAERLYGGHLAAQPRATMLPLIGQPDETEPPTAALFLPPTSTLWHTPGFMALMVKIGLVDYWRRGSPPDFCLTPDMQKACRTAGIPDSSMGSGSAQSGTVSAVGRRPLA